ncbi:unnamed protein product [Phyllotreta striolata]|uniref:Uncharacterized protein n=1 Tax=Phyllotreta striolata TaxID=444603 RepID=A0A9N9TD97_PHYSR|nr:unnamed protein product [Phyllotreta striolata]
MNTLCGISHRVIEFRLKSLAKMLIVFTLVFVAIITNEVSCISCDRSRTLLGAEDVCWTSKVQVIERISHTQKKVLNFAKKSLGLETEEIEPPQKCDYYYCIFKEMNLINPEYDVPCEERLTKWVKRNVKYEEALSLLDRLQFCAGELKTSLGAHQQFLASNVGKTERTINETDQSRCDIAAEFMKCLAHIQLIDPECPVFQYP